MKGLQSWIFLSAKNWPEPETIIFNNVSESNLIKVRAKKIPAFAETEDYIFLESFH